MAETEAALAAAAPEAKLSPGAMVVKLIDALVHRYVGLILVGLLGAGAGSLGTSAMSAPQVEVTATDVDVKEQLDQMMLILCLLAAEHGSTPAGCEEYEGLRLAGPEAG